MLILDATNRTLNMTLGANVTTNPLVAVASYVDISANSFIPGSITTTGSNTSSFSIVAAPAVGLNRQVKQITIFNQDTANAIVKVVYVDGGANRTLVQVTLTPNQTVQYTDGIGFTLANSVGGSGNATVYSGTNGIVVGGTTISPTYGSAGGTICQGNDTRLSDARTPIGMNLTPVQIWVGNASGVAANVSMSGDGSLASNGALTITKVNGLPYASTMPSSGQVEIWNATSGRFEPGTISSNGGGNGTVYTGINGISVVGSVINATYGAVGATICQGNDTRLSDARTPVGTSLTTGTVWLGNATSKAAEVAIGGIITIASNGTANLTVAANEPFTGSATALGLNLTTNGGLSKVGGNLGISLAAGSPLSMNGSGLNVSYTGINGVVVSGSTINHTFGSIGGTVCQGNDTRLSDARTPVGTNLTPAQFWVGNATGVAANVAMSGDGNITSAGLLTITKVNGVNYSSATPANGQVEIYNSTSGRFEPGTISSNGGGGSNLGIATNEPFTIASNNLTLNLAANSGLSKANSNLTIVLAPNSGLALGSSGLFSTNNGSGGSSLALTSIKTTNYTASVNDHVLCDAAAAGSNFTISLPGSPTLNGRVRVSLVAENATRKVLLSPNGLPVNGISNNLAFYDLCLAGDTIEFLCANTTLGWIISENKLTPHFARLKATACQTFTGGAWTKVLLPSLVHDVGPISVAASSKFVPRRSGRYIVVSSGYAGASNSYISYANNGTLIRTLSSPIPMLASAEFIAAGDNIELWAYLFSTGTASLPGGDQGLSFAILEVRV